MAKTLTDEQIAIKKSELVQIAMGILEAEGLQALTLRHLATQAGISRTTPYLYFKDKADLLQEICAETFRYLIQKCRQGTEHCTSDLEKIMELGCCYLDFGIERPTLYHLIFGPENPEDELSPTVLALVEEYKALSSEPLMKAYEEGIINYPPDRLNPVLWACSHGLLCLRWAGHLSEEGMYERVREDMETILGVGFLNKEKLQDLDQPC